MNANITATIVLAKTNLDAGQPTTDDVFENADRSQQVATGAKVHFHTSDVVAWIPQASGTSPDALKHGTIEYVLVKVTNQENTPSTPNVSDTSQGLQIWARQHYPGRVLQFGVIGISNTDSRSRKITINLRKFRMSQFRQGDYLVLWMKNNSAHTAQFNHYGRFKDYT